MAYAVFAFPCACVKGNSIYIPLNTVQNQIYTYKDNSRKFRVESRYFCGFNSVLNNRLDKFLVENKIIDDCQIGFTKKTRTCDHMFNLKCIFDKYCNEKNGELYVCFVEFHKAFDTI